jgi:hypothetical protein
VDYTSPNGRRRLLHHYRKTRPGQVRGVPWLAPVVELIKQIGRFTEAEVEKAISDEAAYLARFTESGAVRVPDFVKGHSAEQDRPAMMRDMLNTAIASAVAAIENVGATAIYDTGTGRAITYRDINTAHSRFGDSSQLIVADVMDGVTYHGLIDANLANAQQLFLAQSVRVVDILGRRVVVTDAPALRETPATSTNDIKVLSLVAGGATVYNAGDLITNIETSNGKLRIETTMQADYTYGVALKGYQWDTANGGKSPTDAELATGSNWDKVATSIKHTAGVLTLSQAA